MRSSGMVGRHGAQIVRFLERDHAGKADVSPNSTHSAAVSAVPVNECMTPRQRPARPCFAEHGQHVGIAFARMDDKRQIALLRQPQMPIEIILLHVERA